MQLARLALIVAVPGRCGGSRGGLARRRRRGPEGLRAAGGAQARNVSPEGLPDAGQQLRRACVSVPAARRLPRSAISRVPAGGSAPLKTLEKVLTGRMVSRMVPQDGATDGDES